jgi:hypothetical protein
MALLLEVGCNCGGSGTAVSGTDGAGETQAPDDATAATTAGSTATTEADTEGGGSGDESSGSGGPEVDNCGYTFAALPASLSLGYVSDVAVTDLDDDGLVDLVVCRASPEAPGAVSVLLGTGPNAFADPVDFDSPGVHDVEVADFDEDGALDVLIVGHVSDAQLLAHAGGGALELTTTVGVGSTNCYDLEVADIDLDGHLDFVTSCESQETTTDPNEHVTARRGLGDGTFEYFATLGMQEPRGIHLADLDGDMLPELLATMFAPMGDPMFLVYDNTGDDFVLDTSLPLTWGGDIASGDLDDDGDLDVLVAQEWEPDLRGVVLYFENTGAGLSAPTVLDFDGAPFSIEIADFDGDDVLDFVTVGTDGFLQFGIGHGDGTFDRGSVHGVGSARWAVKVADIDGDAIPDVVHAASRGVVTRIDPAGAFPALPSAPAPVEPTAVAAADFDADGHLDLATATEGTLAIQRGAGDGTFAEIWTGTAPGYEFRGLATGDLDGDGDVDLVLSGTEGTSMRFGNGDGTLAEPVLLSTTPATGAPRTGDVDGDGIDDAVAPRDGGILVFASTTTELVSHSVDGIGVHGIDVADIDGDGALDYLVAEGGLHFVRGDGAAGFGETDVFDVEAGLSRVLATDLDGDGDLDVVGDGRNHPAGVVFGGLVWLENRDGALQPPQYTDPLGLEVHALASADLDRDGADDIVTMEGASMTSSLYRGGPGPSLAHDATFAITGVGRAPWKQGLDGGLAIGDYDEDGTLDVAFADLGQDRITLLFGLLLQDDACH